MKKIEKLDPSFMGSNAGSCGASLDEVILKINEIVDVLNGEPELRESEDERIRKEMIEFFQCSMYCDDLDTDKIKRWVAYLERQKDEVQRQFNLGMQAGREEVIYEMERKQKPVNSYKPTYEQMEALRFAVNHLAKEHVSQSVRLSIMYDHLKETEGQKPAEWSEEDEKMLKRIEAILLTADDDLSDKLNGKVSPITDSAYSSMKICIAKCLAWLKSLRPSQYCENCKLKKSVQGWKPSEEQMNLLLNIEGDLRAFQYNNKAKALAELYEQLKRL